jgi:hypothetical protein
VDAAAIERATPAESVDPAEVTVTRGVLYERALVDSLRELGGQARAHKALPLVEKKMRPHLRQTDYERDSKTVRWKHAVYSAAERLRKASVMRNAAFGAWQLTESS